MGKSAPEPPDPFATAQAQAQFNQQTAATQQAMNMVNQYNPWGSVTYDQIGEQVIAGPHGTLTRVPRYSQTTRYTPEQQRVFDQTNRAQSALAMTAANQAEFLRDYMGHRGADTSGAPALAVPNLQTSMGPGFATSVGPNFNQVFRSGIDGGFDAAYAHDAGPEFRTSFSGADDFSADRQRFEDALMQRMEPQLRRDEDRLRSQLINQGIRPGSAAWNSEHQRMSSNVNDARMAAILNAGNEQARMTNLSRDAAAFTNQAVLQRAGFGSQQQQLQNAAALAQAGFGNQAAASVANFANNAALQQAQLQNAARSQVFNEAYQARNQPINEITALLSGSQIQNPGQMSSATPQTGVGGVDFSGLATNAYNQEAQNYRAGIDGISRLAAAPFSMFNFGFGGGGR